MDEVKKILITVNDSSQNLPILAEESSSKTVQVLHVDDDVNFLEATKDFIECFTKLPSNDIEIVVNSYHSPETALHDLTFHQYDLIITDFKMPNMNGLKFLEKMRSLNSIVPSVMLSSDKKEEIAKMDDHKYIDYFHLEKKSGVLFKLLNLISALNKTNYNCTSLIEA